ncbi:MAG: hypothetical protein LBE84_04980 [Planctomycetota bacterium]|nr:hypothetical protein [Planctomycetota bacterium]
MNGTGSGGRRRKASNRFARHRMVRDSSFRGRAWNFFMAVAGGRDHFRSLPGPVSLPEKHRVRAPGEPFHQHGGA